MSFPRYPEYQDSGVAWLGEVPAHWFVGKVKHITSFFTGWTPPTGNAAFYEGENPWANISDLGPKWLVEPSKRISDEAVGHSGIRLSPTGSLLFSFKLSIGQVSFAARDMYTNEAIATFPPSERLNLAFAYYALPLYVVQNASENIYGAKLLNQELIKAASVAVPSIREQQAIATFLDRETAKIDALVAEQEKLIALLQEKRQAVISHAVTKGLDPNVPMKDSGVDWLGAVPGHWEVKRIKHLVASLEQGWSPQCEGFPVQSDDEWGILKVGCVNGGVFRPEENKTLPPELEPVPALGLAAGDLLISRANTRELVGGAAVALKDYPKLMLCDKLYRLRFQPNVCEPTFLALYLGTPQIRGQIELAATGASSSMLNIGQSTILELDVAMPPVDEQRRILNVVSDQMARADTLTAEARTAITLLQERRTALISAAVTGQIDVRGIASRGVS